MAALGPMVETSLSSALLVGCRCECGVYLQNHVSSAIQVFFTYTAASPPVVPGFSKAGQCLLFPASPGVDHSSLVTYLQRWAAKIGRFCNIWCVGPAASEGRNGTTQEPRGPHARSTPLPGTLPSVCPNTTECGWGDDSTPFFPDKKTEAQSPGLGTEVKKEWKRPPKGGCLRSRTVLQGSRGLPHYSVSRPQPAAFAIETVIVIFL